MKKKPSDNPSSSNNSKVTGIKISNKGRIVGLVVSKDINEINKNSNSDKAEVENDNNNGSNESCSQFKTLSNNEGFDPTLKNVYLC